MGIRTPRSRVAVSTLLFFFMMKKKRDVMCPHNITRKVRCSTGRHGTASHLRIIARKNVPIAKTRDSRRSVAIWHLGSCSRLFFSGHHLLSFRSAFSCTFSLSCYVRLSAIDAEFVLGFLFCLVFVIVQMLLLQTPEEDRLEEDCLSEETHAAGGAGNEGRRENKDGKGNDSRYAGKGEEEGAGGR